MKATTVMSPHMIRAAMPTGSEHMPKKVVSARVDLSISLSLDSMARALGKSPSALAAELLDGAVNYLSDNLSQVRPDLCRPMSDEQMRYEREIAEHEGIEPDLLPIPTWLTPAAARAQIERQQKEETPEKFDLIPANYPGDYDPEAAS